MSEQNLTTQQQNRSLSPREQEVRSLLVDRQKQIKSLLQDETKASRFLAGAWVVANSQSLQKCTPDSIVQALVGLAMSDLNIDPALGQAYLVPYWSKEGSKAQLQIGYKGMIQLAFRAGFMIKAEPVFTCDKFTWESHGFDDIIEFKPNLDERHEEDSRWCVDNLRGIYVIARHADTRDEFSLFINKNVIEKLRLLSANQKATQYTKPEDKKLLDAGLPVGIWADWYVEMAKAKAIKKLIKTLPIGDARLHVAVAADDRAESGMTIDYVKTADSGIVTANPSVEYHEVVDAKTDYSDVPTLEALKAIKPNKLDKPAWKARFDELSAAPEDGEPGNAADSEVW